MSDRPATTPAASPRYVVISDPGDDPSVEGAFATQEEADAFIEQTLAELDREGLRPDNWRPLFRIEPASEPESS